MSSTTQLRLVPTTSNPTPLPPAKGDRRVFWMVFVNWLADASAEDTEQLERALSRHAHHVRPLVDAVSDAITLQHGTSGLPDSLLNALRAARWEPAARRINSVA